MELPLAVGKDQILQLLNESRARIQNVLDVIRDRGFKALGRPLAVAGILALLGYQYGYRRSVRSLEAKIGQTALLRATAQHAETYKKLEEDMAVFLQRLPPSAQKNEWLLNTIIETSHAEGIQPESISNQVEQEEEGFLQLFITVTGRARYKDVARWVARLEGHSKLLHISSLSLTKISDASVPTPGMNSVNIQIGTVIRK